VTPSGHGVSAGIAEWTADEPDLAGVARADAALYEAKALGGRLARRAEVAA
jgi:GGDEF domain-containing protein